MKYPLPLEIVKGRYPVVAQEYGNQTNNSWYEKNGIKFDASSGGGHNGTDIIVGGGKNSATDTYGTRLVCSIPNALATRVWFDSPMSTKGNGIQLQWNDDKGFCQAIMWHCSECNFQEEYKVGDTLGYIGNSGLVFPKPSFLNAHAGSHLHLGTWVKGVMVNPREIFDFTKWSISDKDTGIEKDLPPIQYFLSLVSQSLKGLFT